MLTPPSPPPAFVALVPPPPPIASLLAPSAAVFEEDSAAAAAGARMLTELTLTNRTLDLKFVLNVTTVSAVSVVLVRGDADADADDGTCDEGNADDDEEEAMRRIGVHTEVCRISAATARAASESGRPLPAATWRMLRAAPSGQRGGAARP